MLKLWLDVIKTSDVVKYLNIEDDCFLYMTGDNLKIVKKRNNTRELFNIKEDKIKIICAGTSTFCDTVKYYMESLLVEIIDMEGNSSSYINIFDARENHMLRYNNFKITLDSSPHLHLTKIETLMDLLVSNLLSDLIQQHRYFNYIVKTGYSDSSRYMLSTCKKTGKKTVEILGNPIVAFSDFCKKELGVTLNEDTKSTCNKILKSYKALNSNNIPEQWLYIDLFNNELVLDYRVEESRHAEDFMQTTSLFGIGNFSTDEDNVII